MQVAVRCLLHLSLWCSSAHADPPEEDNGAAGVSELAAWPPPQDAQDSRLRRSLGAERRQRHAAQRAAQVERLIATEQAVSSAAAPVQAPVARLEAAAPAANTGLREAAAAGAPVAHAEAGAMSGPASQPAATLQHGLPALPGGELRGHAASSAACDEAPHLARDGGELNRTVGRMMLARTVRMGLSPITRRRTLAELRVRKTPLSDSDSDIACLQPWSAVECRFGKAAPRQSSALRSAKVRCTEGLTAEAGPRARSERTERARS